MAGIRGSRLTGVAATAALMQAGETGAVPGGMVVSGRPSIYFLAVCGECGDVVMPFGEESERDNWVVQHPHNVSMGIEIRGISFRES